MLRIAETAKNRRDRREQQPGSKLLENTVPSLRSLRLCGLCVSSSLSVRKRMFGGSVVGATDGLALDQRSCSHATISRA